MTPDTTVKQIIDLATRATEASDSGAVENRLRDLVSSLRTSPLNGTQTAELAIGLAKSGRVLDWAGDQRLAGRISVDLPSTGGASNKTPITAPLIALAAAPEHLFVPKFSSRGRIAGTIDILETAGYDARVSVDEYREIVGAVGISNVVQGQEFAPADGELMRLRRRTGAMNVPELVVSSILAKKLASGCRNVVVDVKTGPDSKLGDLKGIEEGARLFTDAARELIRRAWLDGLWVCCTNGYRPQGRAFGRIPALWESARVLSGIESGFLLDLSIALAARMLVLAEAMSDLDAAAVGCRSVIGERVLSVTRAWLEAHGADSVFLHEPDRLLDTLQNVRFDSPTGGVLLGIDIGAIGQLLTRLGSTPATRKAIGLVFDEEASAGRSLSRPLKGGLLAPPGMAWSGDEALTAANAIISYRGEAPVHERPMIIYERAITRSGEYERACWSRLSRAAIAVIRRHETREVLLVWNRKWSCWNLLAGHFEAERDADLAETMARELSEELGPELAEAPLVKGRDFALCSLGTYRDIWHSRSAGQWTLYEFELFEVRFTNPERIGQLVRNHWGVLRWATPAELRMGRIADGGSVAPFPVTVLAVQHRLGD